MLAHSEVNSVVTPDDLFPVRVADSLSELLSQRDSRLLHEAVSLLPRIEDLSNPDFLVCARYLKPAVFCLEVESMLLELCVECLLLRLVSDPRKVVKRGFVKAQVEHNCIVQRLVGIFRSACKGYLGLLQGFLVSVPRLTLEDGRHLLRHRKKFFV